MTLDHKFAQLDRVSLGFQYNWNHLFTTNHSIAFNPLRVNPGDFSPTHTHGAPGAGNLEGSSFARIQSNLNYMPTLTWRHDGPVWKADADAGLSRASNRDRDMDKGIFKGTTVRRTGVTARFDDIYYLGPREITVLDAAGRPINPYDLANYALISASSTQQDSIDIQRSAHANLRRDFYGRVPFSAKVGISVNNSIRDLNGSNPSYLETRRPQRRSAEDTEGLSSPWPRFHLGALCDREDKPQLSVRAYCVISRESVLATTVRIFAVLASHSAACGLVATKSRKAARRSRFGVLMVTRCEWSLRPAMAR